MNKITIKTSDSLIEPLYNISKNVLYLSYPCSLTYVCTSYSFYLSPGAYLLELYGAGAGSTTGSSTLKREDFGTNCIDENMAIFHNGNAECSPGNSAGSGGFISGILTLKKRTKLFARIGGKGQVGNMSNADILKGGFNGGGSSMYYTVPSTSGGGATDIRAEEDDFWHRIIVAGGGGGTDNKDAQAGAIGDGSGGAGGYPNGQSFWIDGKYQDKMFATQSYGFSFGQGESASNLNVNHKNSTTGTLGTDRAGAGGGWFGGHSSKHGDGGAGGGSSYILTENSYIPQGLVPTHDELYNTLFSREYAFTNKSPYAMKLAAYANGINSGNGFIKITRLSFINSKCRKHSVSHTHLLLYAILLC